MRDVVFSWRGMMESRFEQSVALIRLYANAKSSEPVPFCELSPLYEGE